MAPAGGSKEHVRIAPFGTKPPAPSDYAHLTDISTVSFAKSLAASMPDTRKVAAPKKKKVDPDADEDDDAAAEAEKEAMEKAKPKNASKIDPDDLARFLESEGGGDAADMCQLPRCMDVVTQIILNDKNSKIEKELIQEEILELMKQLKESEKEEEKITKQAEAQMKEIIMLEKNVEAQTGTLKHIESKKEASETYKRNFSSQQALLEKDQRNWVTKFKTAQTALSKAIWRKPGQIYDDEEASIFDGSVRTIKTASIKELAESDAPSALPYEALANLDKVSDYNEVPHTYPTYPRYVQDQLDIKKINEKRVPKPGFSFVNTRTSANASRGTVDDEASMVSYRKGLQMRNSVKSFLECPAAKSLKRSITNPFMPLSPTRSSGASVLSIMNSDVNTVRTARSKRSGRHSPENSHHSSATAANLTASINRSPHLKPIGHDYGDDDHSVGARSISSVGNVSALTSNQSVSSSSFSVVSASGRNTNTNTMPKKLPLPKNTGKTRIIQSGIGKLTRRPKSIAELLAEEEALN